MSVQYKDYYNILGVDRQASGKEVKSAFRKLARKYHPDATTGDEEKFKELNEAYEVLGDADKRKLYNNLGPNYRHGSNFEPPPGFDGFSGAENFSGRGPGGYSQNINLNDLGAGGGGFSDFFDLLFGQMGAEGQGAYAGGSGRADPRGGHSSAHAYARAGTGRQASPKRKALSLHIEKPLSLTLSEVASGTDKTVQLGRGGHKVTVKIPKGVKPGAKIRLSGEGKRRADGKSGDLFLIVNYKKHPDFTVDDLNLLYEASVPVPDLVLGGEIKVPTLQKPVNLTLTKGTQAGVLMRLKGLGLPGKNETQGDIRVRIRAKIPKEPSQKEIKLYQELQQLETD